MKTCVSCKQDKSHDNFWKAVKSKDGLNWNCKECCKKQKIVLKTLTPLKKSLSEESKKLCTGCKAAKPIQDFMKDKKGEFGLKSKCKACINDIKKMYRQKLRQQTVSSDEKVHTRKQPLINDVNETCKNKSETVKARKLMRYQSIINQQVVEARKLMRYQSISECVLHRGCKLLTTFEDCFNNKLHSKSRYEIVAACGHNHSVQYDMFKAQQCGARCKICSDNDRVVKCSLLQNNQGIEYEGFKYVRDQLVNLFQVVKMVEGTLADFAVKPLGHDKDELLAIQLKVTSTKVQKPSGNYSFTINKDYPDMYLLLICLEDKSIWLVNGNEVIGCIKISIGSKRSKYFKYQTTDIGKTLMEMWQVCVKHTFNTLNTPIGIPQQKEQKFRRRREEFLPYINFEYPEQEALPYDFTINGLRVQEKVASLIYKRGKLQHKTYAVKLSRHTHTKSKKYNKGDNDFYWINIPDTSEFFLLPEKDCIDHGIVNNAKTVAKYVAVTLYTEDKPHVINNWMYKFLYDYKIITPGQICNILNIQR